MTLESGPFSFTLPPELEATAPPEARGVARDAVRLLVSYRRKDGLVHAEFHDLPQFLDAGDLLAVNNSATIPAALPSARTGGAPVALHLSTHLPGDLWIVEPRQVAVQPGETLTLPGGGAATLLEPYKGSRRLWLARLHLPQPPLPYLERWGKPVAYPHAQGEWPLAAYQTIFASVPGSAEMPSAGRAFTAEVVAALAQKGVRIAEITLHTGVSSLERDEPPYEEWFEVSPLAAAAVNETRRAGRRVVAVGTTAVRALESATDGSGQVVPQRGWTDLVITPERGVRVVDGLLTGFHEPRASHLSLLEAFAGRPHLRRTYRAALRGRYLWHEFGDLHLIL